MLNKQLHTAARRDGTHCDRVHLALQCIAQRRELNAFIELFPDDALATARRLDDGASSTRALTAGMTIAIKDNIHIAGKACGAASRMLDGYIAPYDAQVIERLRVADAILLGRANMDEFGMGSSGESSCHGHTRHPWLSDRVPGGSSSGSACAVAAGLADAALGSDAGGSVRQPAAFCGIVGIKPTYGRVSRWGLISFAPSFEQIGVLSPTVRGNAALLGCIAGADERDATTVPLPVPDYVQACDRGVTGLRIGMVAAAMEGDDPAWTVHAVDVAAERLRSGGALCTAVHAPSLDAVLPAYMVIAGMEALSNLARYEGMRYGRRVDAGDFDASVDLCRAEGFGEEVQRRLLQGAWLLAAGEHADHYGKAQRVREALRREWLTMFVNSDVLLLPVCPQGPFVLGERRSDARGMREADRFTALANLIGVPAMSVPLDALPDGSRRAVQLLAPPFGEEALYAVAAALEAVYDV